MGLRATLSARTVVCYVATGMLAAPTAIFLVHRVVNPYYQPAFPYTPLLTWAMSVATLCLLLAPVILRLVRRRVYVLLSVADAFLLGFALGLGFDALGVLLALREDFDVWRSLTLLPPWQQEVFGLPWLMGTAYRTGWLAAVVVGAQRLIASRPVRLAAVSGAALWVAVDGVAWSWRFPSDDASLWATFQAALYFVTAQGVLTPWIVAVTVVALQVLEARWVGDDPFAFLREWRALAEDVRRLAWRDALKRHVAFCRARQLRIAEAELRRAPGDSVIASVVARIRALPGDEQPALPVAAAVPSIVIPGWAVLAAPWLLLCALLAFPGGVERALAWLAIAGVLFWYVTGPVRIGGFRGGDDVARFYAEHYLMLGALTLAVLVAFSLLAGPIFPTAAVSLSLPGPRREDSPELAMLVLAAAGLSLTWGRRARWREEPLRARRIHALQRGLGVASIALVTWAGVSVYLYAIPLIHQKWGVYIAYIASVPASAPRPEDMWWWARLIHLEVPEPFGNNLPAWWLALVIAPAAGALLLALHRLSSAIVRAVASLVDDGMGTAPADGGAHGPSGAAGPASTDTPPDSPAPDAGAPALADDPGRAG